MQSIENGQFFTCNLLKEWDVSQFKMKFIFTESCGSIAVLGDVCVCVCNSNDHNLHIAQCVANFRRVKSLNNEHDASHKCTPIVIQFPFMGKTNDIGIFSWEIFSWMQFILSFEIEVAKVELF